MRLHLYPLDAVRFFAAFCVLAFHLAFYAWAAPGSTVGHMFAHAATYPQLAPVTWFGWVGVEIFFVISGFVIANSANSSSPIKFVKSRVLRLYPAAWFCAMIAFLAWVLIDGAAWTSLVSRLARSLSLWVTGPWIDAVYWTLAVEMIFYLVIFVVLMGRQFAQLPWIALALIALPGAYLGLSASFGEVLFQSGAWRAFADVADLMLLRHGAFFGVGIFMWLYSVRGLRAWEWLSVGGGVAVCCLEILLRARGMSMGETEAQMAMPALIPIAVWLTVLALMFMFARSPQKFEPRSRAVQGLLQHLGKMTYPLYLTHAVLGAGLMRVLIANGVNPWMSLIVAMAAMLGLASLIAEFAEPFIRKGLRGALEQLERAMQRAPAFAFLFQPGGAVAAKAAAPN